MAKKIEDEPDVIGCMITDDESWIQHFDPTIKQKTMHWKSLQSPVTKKVCQAKLTNKIMLILFFEVREAIYQHIVPRHMAINALCYYKVLRTLKRHMNKKRPDLKKIWLLHHNNTQPHNASTVKEFLEKNCSRIPCVQFWPCTMRFSSFWSSKMWIAQ